jgi:hypothetical protein
MMRAMVICGTLAIALPFILASVASSFGPAVSERFLERPTELPAEVGEGPLTASLLQAWASGSDTAGHAKGYAHRVIPIDMLYLVFLGLFLGLAASYVAGLVSWPAWVAARPAWMWWILPGAYILFDFAEDSLIFVLLTWPSSIAEASLGFLSVVRSAKIASVGASMGLVVLLGLVSFI